MNDDNNYNNDGNDILIVVIFISFNFSLYIQQ